MGIGGYTLPDITVSYTVTNDAKEGVDDIGYWCELVLKCLYVDRHTLMQELRGYIATGGTIVQPAALADIVWARRIINNLTRKARVSDVQISAFGGDVGTDEAALRVRFETPPYEVDGPYAFISEAFEPAAEFLTLPHGKLYWDTGQQDPVDGSQEQIYKKIQMNTWRMTRHMLPEQQVPIAVEAMDWVGSINMQTHYSPRYGKTFEPETLLMTTAPLTRETDTAGGTKFTFAVTMVWRRGGWGIFYKKGQSTPQELYDESGLTYFPYPILDWSTIIPIP